MKGRSLRHNFTWTFAGSLTNAGCQWGLLVLLAKMGGPESLGLYAWAMAIALPIVTVSMFQLRTIFVVGSHEEYGFGSFLSLRLVGMLASIFCIVAIGWFVSDSSDALLVLCLVAVSRGLDGVSDIFRALFQRVELMHLSGISMMLRGVCSLFAVGITYAMTDSLPLAMSALCVAWLVLVLCYELPMSRRLLSSQTASPPEARPMPPWRFSMAVLPAAVPLGLVLGLIAFQTSLPRLFLSHFHGKGAVGFFAAIAAIPAMGVIVVTALGQSAMPRLSRLYTPRPGDFLRLLGKLMLIGIALGVSGVTLAWLIGASVIRIAYAPEFASYHTELVILSVGSGMMFLACFVGYALSAAKKFMVQPIIVCGSCSVALLCCYLFIPQAGVRGAAYAYLLTAGAQLAISLTIFVAIFKRHLPTQSQVSAIDGGEVLC